MAGEAGLGESTVFTQRAAVQFVSSGKPLTKSPSEIWNTPQRETQEENHQREDDAKK